jgi:membrane protease YdiL (CAAX protease family)
MISLSIPLAGVPKAFGFAAVSMPLLITGTMTAKMTGLTPVEMGISFGTLRGQLLTALLGLPLGFAGFFLIRPSGIYASETPKELLMWSLILIICTGLLEEFLFRGILFSLALKWLGDKKALYFTSLMYAALTISGKSFVTVMYAFLVSALFCWLFIRQKSILGLSLAHGMINVLLYVICPLIFNY